MRGQHERREGMPSRSHLRPGNVTIAILRQLALVTVVLIASACTSGSQRLHALRLRASTRHGCPIDAVTPVNEFAPPAGVVVSVCGVEHYYVLDGEYREVRDLPPRARVVRVLRGDGAADGSSDAACPSGQIYVRGYSRGGRRVRGYCRRR
jgi:hypothetical protein